MEKEKFRQRLYRALDLEPDALPHSSLVEIRDASRLRAGGCERILVYTDTEIRLAIPRGALSVRGEGLVCSSYLRGEIEIDGKIVLVEFVEGKE